MQISTNLGPGCQGTYQYILAHTGTSEYILDYPVFDALAVYELSNGSIMVEDVLWCS